MPSVQDQIVFNLGVCAVKYLDGVDGSKTRSSRASSTDLYVKQSGDWVGPYDPERLPEVSQRISGVSCLRVVDGTKSDAGLIQQSGAKRMSPVEYRVSHRSIYIGATTGICDWQRSKCRIAKIHL